ncbi:MULTISPECIES: methyltransferase domain-containing protein [unclassified Streptomyces]|uniref:methyltransferase domain-containing protein n=1 Tax=unclassified Streptomyces TaxID=2593676 RepID=UPI0034420EDF
MGSAAARDPLFAGIPEWLRVLHWHGDTMDLPAEAVALASCDRYPVQAFRVGAAAWGLQFHLEVDAAAVGAFARAFPEEAAAAPGGLCEDAHEEPAVLAPYRDRVLGRFAALAAGRAGHTSTRTFFTPMAETWEERFAADGPSYAAAVARMGLGEGRTVLDLGCGTGRALPALRAAVGDKGLVLGIDVTPAMLDAAARHGRTDLGPVRRIFAGPRRLAPRLAALSESPKYVQYEGDPPPCDARHQTPRSDPRRSAGQALAALLLADACRLPLSSGAVDGVFSAGLVNHLPEPAPALAEWARVTAPGGTLLLFHPSGRAERAARHGRTLDPDDLLAETNLRAALETAGWRPACYDDAPHHFLALAVRAG